MMIEVLCFLNGTNNPNTEYGQMHQSTDLIDLSKLLEDPRNSVRTQIPYIRVKVDLDISYEEANFASKKILHRII